MRKANEDVIARSVAENQVGDLMWAATGTGSPDRDKCVEDARIVLNAFKAVEFEKTVRQIGDEKVYLRRLAITGPWEVDPAGDHA